MSEQVREVELPPRFWSLSAYCLGIIVGLFGIDPYFSEPRVYWISSLYYYVPFLGGNAFDYIVVVILWSVVFYYLLINIHRQYRSSLGSMAALMVLLTEITWTCTIIISLVYGEEHKLFELGSVLFIALDLFFLLLSIGTITMGIAMVLLGVIYAQNFSGTSRILLPLVVISFIVVGFLGILVGSSIFSPLDIFTFFDIPLVSIAMIIPCTFGALYHLDEMIDHVIAEYRPN